MSICTLKMETTIIMAISSFLKYKRIEIKNDFMF